MEHTTELTTPEISQETLAAAEILGCDPQALYGLYGNEFGEDIEDNEILSTQIEDIYLATCTFLDTENKEIKDKFFRAMEIDPLFRNFVFDFLIDNCAEEAVRCSSMLSEETFKEALTLIDKDEALKEQLDDAIDGSELMRADQISAVNLNLRIIRISLDYVLRNDLDEELFLPDSDSRKIHEAAFKATKNFGVGLSKQEQHIYETHSNLGPCSICNILESIREFSDFQDFLDFIKEAREFVDIMNDSRKPKPMMD